MAVTSPTAVAGVPSQLRSPPPPNIAGGIATRRAVSPNGTLLGERSPRLRGSGTAGSQVKPELPIPKVTCLSSEPRGSRKKLAARPATYIAKTTVTLEAAMATVDYDIDEADEKWLQQTNGAVDEGLRLSEDMFEKMINLYEKLSLHQGRAATFDEVRAGFETTAAAVPDVPLIMQWLSKVFGYWESRRKKGKIHLRWAAPVSKPAVGSGARYRSVRSAGSRTASRRPSDPARLGAPSRSEPSHGNFQLSELGGAQLPHFDLQMLEKGCVAVLPNVQTHLRRFEPLASIPGSVENGGAPSAAMAGPLQKRLESERKCRIEAERKLKHLSRGGATEGSNTLKRKFDASIEEYERALQGIEANLDEIQVEEANLRRKYEEEKKRADAERKKYEAERRERTLRDQELDRTKKKFAKDRVALEKKIREQDLVKKMMEQHLREGFQKWALEQEVVMSVESLLGECEAFMGEDLPAIEQEIRATGNQEMANLKTQLEGEFRTWKDTFLARYLQAPAAVPPSRIAAGGTNAALVGAPAALVSGRGVSSVAVVPTVTTSAAAMPPPATSPTASVMPSAMPLSPAVSAPLTAGADGSGPAVNSTTDSVTKGEPGGS